MIKSKLTVSGYKGLDSSLQKLNVMLCDAIMYLHKEAGKDEISIETLKQQLTEKFEALEGMTEDHSKILKWHHEALCSVTMQAQLLEMVALGVSLVCELLYLF